MGASRRIAAFACWLLLIYGALTALLPVLAPPYAVLFSAGGNLIFQSLVPDGYVHMHPMSDPTALHDTHVHVTNRRTGGTAMVGTDSRMASYLPTAFLVSLLLATPLPWRRKLWAMALGLILVNVFIACQLLIIVLHAFCDPQVSLLALPSPWYMALAAAREIASSDAVTWFMVPGLIWILVSFRQTDWAALVRVDACEAAEQANRVPRRGRRRRMSGRQRSR